MPRDERLGVRDERGVGLAREKREHAAQGGRALVRGDRRGGGVRDVDREVLGAVRRGRGLRERDRERGEGGAGLEAGFAEPDGEMLGGPQDGGGRGSGGGGTRGRVRDERLLVPDREEAVRSGDCGEEAVERVREDGGREAGEGGIGEEVEGGRGRGERGARAGRAGRVARGASAGRG